MAKSSIIVEVPEVLSERIAMSTSSANVAWKNLASPDGVPSSNSAW